METLVKKVNSDERLSFAEYVDFFDSMVNGNLTEAQIGSALIALRLKGESEEEISAAATVLNRYKIKLDVDLKNKVDTCGTGGDGKSTINVSTIVSIVLGSFGFNVVKHGNVAQSGKVGSADILEMMGVPVKLTKEEAEKFLLKHNFVFLFAPNYHPILKSVGKIRRELKVPTIFNYLGPMLNPADPEYQLIGINSVAKLDVYAKALVRLNRNNILVVSSKDGYDEISSCDITFARKVTGGKIEKLEINPKDFFKPFDMPRVENSDEATELFKRAIEGGDEDLNNLIAINTAYAFQLIENEDLNDIFERIKNKLKNGEVRKYFESLRGN
ncbi:anthranilate phosphoribosyltransferase [Deferribacteraceae bacterium V6Fe1]|nr:anthranilate phosphoribosyltransferase [Deferribacteraceae bacterium V6Fe1]